MNAIVAVCTPTVHDRQRSLEWADRYRQVCATLPPGWFPVRQKHYMIDRSRQVLAERAIEGRATHILWWDDDCVPRVDGYLRMRARHYPWCTGVYVDRAGHQTLGLFTEQTEAGWMAKPTTPLAAGEQGYFDACGLGFCLMETALLRRLQPPWFRFEVRPDGTFAGEDFWVSQRIRRELGVRVLADGDVWVDQEELCWHGPDGNRTPVWAASGMVERL